MRIIIAGAKPLVGYKVMRFHNGKIVSHADSNYVVPNKVGTTLRAGGKGIYLSLSKDFVLKYYSGLADMEALLTLEFSPADIVSGNLTDKEGELSVSKAKIKKIEILEPTDE